MKAFDAFEQLNIFVLHIPMECWELQAMKLERCFIWDKIKEIKNETPSRKFKFQIHI